jgi:hypothetical protein
VIWPFSAFWHRHQTARLENADLPNLPRELDPYERFLIRWLFAEGKVLLLVPVGALLGLLLMRVLYGGRFLP